MIACHRAGDLRTLHCKCWRSRKTLCNTSGSETCRCIYMQVVWWLQACQSLSDKVQTLPMFLLSLYSSFPHWCSVFPAHVEVRHWGTVLLTYVTLPYSLWGVKEPNRHIWRGKKERQGVVQWNSGRIYAVTRQTDWCLSNGNRSLFSPRATPHSHTLCSSAHLWGVTLVS